MAVQIDPGATTRASLERARLRWGDGGAAVLETGYAFGDGAPVAVHVRKRGSRYDLHDEGAAVRKAGRPRGWLELVEDVVAEAGFNVNRAGVVFVPVVEGRDLAAIAARLAACALDVHAALLELRDPEP
jgi:hypothetical protein